MNLNKIRLPVDKSCVVSYSLTRNVEGGLYALRGDKHFFKLQLKKLHQKRKMDKHVLTLVLRDDWDTFSERILSPAMEAWNRDKLAPKAVFALANSIIESLRVVGERQEQIIVASQERNPFTGDEALAEEEGLTGHDTLSDIVDNSPPSKFVEGFAEWIMATTYPVPDCSRMLLLASHICLDTTEELGCRSLDLAMLISLNFEELAHDVITKEFNSVVSSYILRLVQLFHETLHLDAIRAMILEADQVYNTYALYTLLSLGPYFAMNMELPADRVQRSAVYDEMDTAFLMASQVPNEVSIDLVLGPTNDYTERSVFNRCAKYGCRMLSCLCRGQSYFGDEDDLELDTLDMSFDMVWFTGACEMCMIRIPIAAWAVRRPIPGGGWRGCYCSWEHVLTDPYGDEVEVGDRFLIDHLRKRCNVVSRKNDTEAQGIYDAYDQLF